MCVNEEIWLKLRFRLSITIGLSFERPKNRLVNEELTWQLPQQQQPASIKPLYIAQRPHLSQDPHTCNERLRLIGLLSLQRKTCGNR